MSIDKTVLLSQIETHLRAELASLTKSAETARDAATNEESKPENKYDTRGLEASYLAGAQKQRADEIEAKLQQLSIAQLKSFEGDDKIAPTALVTLVGESSTCIFFLFNLGAGYQLTESGRSITCVSTQSPMGQALRGKSVGELVTVGATNNIKEFEILEIS